MGKGAVDCILRAFQANPCGERCLHLHFCGLFCGSSVQRGRGFLWIKCAKGPWVACWRRQGKMLGKGAVGCIFTVFSGEPLGHSGEQRGCGLRFLRAFQANPVGNVRFCVEGCLSWWEKVFVAGLCGLLCSATHLPGSWTGCNSPPAPPPPPPGIAPARRKSP